MTAILPRLLTPSEARAAAAALDARYLGAHPHGALQVSAADLYEDAAARGTLRANIMRSYPGPEAPCDGDYRAAMQAMLTEDYL